MKYVQTPIVVDAVQFTKEMGTGKAALPKGVSKEPCQHVPGDFRFYVQVKSDSITVEVDDWIVYADRTVPIIVKSGLFDLMYEPFDLWLKRVGEVT